MPPHYPRHCEERSDEAIHVTAQRKSGLLRCARNDEDRPRRTRYPRSRDMTVMHGAIAGSEAMKLLPPPQMIGQRQRHAVAQRGFGDLFVRLEQNAPVAAVAQFRIELAEGLDQVGLAVEVNRVLAGLGLHLVDPDRAAASGFRREIARLPP